MTTRRIIPDAYTEYEDGHLGVVPPSLANVEAKIGAANGGQPGKVYTLAGPDAKNQAKTIFKGGPLLHGIEEAFDAGSTRIHAVRLGSAQRASITCKDIADNDVLTIKGDYGSSGNKHYVNVMQQLNSIISGYAAVFAGSPNKVVFYDEDFEVVSELELDPQITTVVGVDAEIFPEAAQPYVGEENDAAGEGLRRLESAMSRPLEVMRDAGQIDSFDLSAVSTENDRLLGDVYVSLGIQPRRAMEMIYTTVYLR